MTHSTLNIGNVELLALVDTVARAPVKAIFPDVTPEQWLPYHAYLADDGATLPLTMPAFVVRSRGKTIVIDTGIGAKNRPGIPNGRLPDALAEAGVDPAAVDIVMATHIHIDHVGWHTTERDGRFVPTFPNATYVFHRPEYEFFTEPANAAKAPWVADCVAPLERRAEISLVDGEHKLTDDLTLMPTPGHTPGHVAVGIISAGESGVLIGDVAHNAAQLIEPDWMPIFDMNPALASESRAKLAQKIEDEGLITVAGHFTHPGFGRLVRVEGRRTWSAL